MCIPRRANENNTRSELTCYPVGVRCEDLIFRASWDVLGKDALGGAFLGRDDLDREGKHVQEFCMGQDDPLPLSGNRKQYIPSSD